MTNPKHTPGPWHIGVRQPTSDKFIYGPTGAEIADCDMVTNFPDENLANVRLVASAPELLEALQWVFQFTPKGAASDRVQRIINQAKGE